jgi:hypothetical protein
LAHPVAVGLRCLINLATASVATTLAYFHRGRSRLLIQRLGRYRFHHARSWTWLRRRA